MRGSEIEITGQDGRQVTAWLAAPAEGSGPGIVLCNDASVSMREFASLLGQEGYVVVAPDSAVHDIGGAISALRSAPNCKGRIAALGYGAGAVPALRAAASGAVDCAVAYCDADTGTLLYDAIGARVPLMLHFPGSRPQSDYFAGCGDIETYSYPDAAPGFAVPGGPHYHKPSADMAYTRTLALFRKIMGPHYDLSSLWEAHRACEFVTRDVEATMQTMVEQPYVNHIPTMTGGHGQKELHRFYKHHFIPKSPKDTRNIPISRTVGADRVVNEGVLCFTHDTEIDWMLPGVAPTGKYVEVPIVGIVTFRGDKLCHEHIYWDQASVLVQIGLLDPRGLPVAGSECARKVLDPSRPSNTLMAKWADSANAD